MLGGGGKGGGAKGFQDGGGPNGDGPPQGNWPNVGPCGGSRPGGMPSPGGPPSCVWYLYRVPMMARDDTAQRIQALVVRIDETRRRWWKTREERNNSRGFIPSANAQWSLTSGIWTR